MADLTNQMCTTNAMEDRTHTNSLFQGSKQLYPKGYMSSRTIQVFERDGKGKICLTPEFQEACAHTQNVLKD
jgi:hypothetical protein